MPYKTGTWGEQAKEREAKRKLIRIRIGKNIPIEERKNFLKEKVLVCEMCDKVHQLGRYKGVVIHHRDENIRNNAINNLMIVCRSCHNKIHHTKTIEPI